MTDFLKEISAGYTKVMKLWIFHKLAVFIGDPRDVEVTLCFSML
jgi:hypothetical protein